MENTKIEFKGTKEWIFDENSSTINNKLDITNKGGIDKIAQFYCGFNYESTLPETRANAKLAFNAPAMFEALISARDTLALLSLLDKSNTCDKQIEKIETLLINATKIN